MAEPIWDDLITWTDDAIWGEDPTEVAAVVGGSVRHFGPSDAVAAATIGGAIDFVVTRAPRPDVSVIGCCASASAAGGRVVLGSATWDASAKTAADGLERYYPLWLDSEDEAEARAIGAIGALGAIGRDIARAVDGAGEGAIASGGTGKMCEVVEQFRGGRSYDVPLTGWDYSRGFTLSMLFRRYEQRQEQALFALGDAVRFGLSWLGELTLEVTLATGDVLRDWSAAVLPVGEWRHVAMSFNPERGVVRGYIDGVPVVSVAIASELASVNYASIGQWADGSLLWGDAQDVRIYRGVKRTEFVAAESSSYCADWVEVA